VRVIPFQWSFHAKRKTCKPKAVGSASYSKSAATDMSFLKEPALPEVNYLFIKKEFILNFEGRQRK